MTCTPVKSWSNAVCSVRGNLHLGKKKFPPKSLKWEGFIFWRLIQQPASCRSLSRNSSGIWIKLFLMCGLSHIYLFTVGFSPSKQEAAGWNQPPNGTADRQKWAHCDNLIILKPTALIGIVLSKLILHFASLLVSKPISAMPGKSLSGQQHSLTTEFS